MDAQVKAAIAHWGPRFVANGVVLTDFEEVTGQIKSYDEWCAAFICGTSLTNRNAAKW